MKKPVLFFSIALITLFFNSCDSLNLNGINSDFSNDEVVSGLKEALNVGTDTAVAQGSETNGFLNNPEIKISFPEDAKTVMIVVEAIPGGEYLIDLFVQKLNSAAEDAATKATPVFKDAILNITFDDAFGILNGSDTAATHYLRDKTFSDLYTVFKPDIQNSLESVGAQQAWQDVIDLYNSIPFTADVNTDLADYTTNKGLDGLFILLGKEEQKIRTDATHRVTELLKQIFGS